MARSVRWVYSPQQGGRPIPEPVRLRLTARLRSHAEARFGGRYTRLDVRFRSQFCYVDLFVEPDKGGPGGDVPSEGQLEHLTAIPIHLCRLRYFGNEDRMSFAHFTYGAEQYVPAVFPNGEWQGLPEDALEISAMLHVQV